MTHTAEPGVASSLEREANLWEQDIRGHQKQLPASTSSGQTIIRVSPKDTIPSLKSMVLKLQPLVRVTGGPATASEAAISLANQMRNIAIKYGRDVAIERMRAFGIDPSVTEMVLT